MNAPRIAVNGRLFPNRLLSYLESLDTAEYPNDRNLFIDPETFELMWWTRGGLTLERLHLWPYVEACECIDAAVLNYKYVQTTCVM